MVASLGPVGDQAVHNNMPDTIGVVERRHVSAVLGDLGLGKALSHSQSNALLIVVRGSTQNQHTVDVDLMCTRKPSQRLQRSGVFHAADRIGTLAVRLVLDPVASPLAHQLAMPEGAGREVIASQDERRTPRSSALELLTPLLDSVRIGKLGVLGEVEGPIDQCRVQAIDVPIVAKTGSARLLIRSGLAKRNVARLPVLGNLARIDLVSQIAIDDVVGPDRRPKRPYLRVDAGDTRNEEVSMSQVEARIGAKRHDGGRRPRSANPGEDAEYAVLVHPQIVITQRKGQDSIEMLALDPVLLLAGNVARVGTLLEHVDDHDFYFNGLGLRESARKHSKQKEGRKETHTRWYRT